ncbi:MAG: hypothetical protein ACPIOQ_73675, partial [Promethearchaeia archaeon]
GELLVRQHPSGVFKKETLYSRHLEKLAAARREQRLQRELLVTEAERAQKKAALELALEQTAREEKEAKDREAAHAHELEQKLALRAAERLANAEEKAAGMANVMKLRETCMKIISDFDFSPTTSPSLLPASVNRSRCMRPQASCASDTCVRTRYSWAAVTEVTAFVCSIKLDRTWVTRSLAQSSQRSRMPC